ncbi:MAG: glycosyltransferase family 4 protein, partial [Candidatus Aminicenantales bacterium]
SHRLRIIRFLQFANYVIRNLGRRYHGDLIIRDFFSTVFAPFDAKRKNIVVIHHLDISSVGFPSLYRWMTRRFFKRIRLADEVVAVSQHWKNTIERAGCLNVTAVYNSFDLDKFEFDPDDLKRFEEKWGFDGPKPIIYLGNARPEKGFLEAFEALRGIDAVFVATGRTEIPQGIRLLLLSYTDYLKLLRICSLVLTMSKFEEGWCRTAHEAMLCGTPVIGSGKGGMEELLSGGQQIVCRDFSLLRSTVIGVLNDKEKMKRMSAAGQEFGRAHSFENFGRSWNDLVDRVVSSSGRKRVLHFTHANAPYGIGSFLLHLLRVHGRHRDID